jgi:cobalt-zinc-cadmium efflux system outer membrane protein
MHAPRRFSLLPTLARGAAHFGVVLTLALACPRVRAETPEQFSLADALRAMRAQHPALAAAQYAIEAARADQVDARLWNNPSASISYTPGVRASSYDRAGYIAYGVTQFLELSNAPGAREQAARLLAAAAQAERQAVLATLALDVESALVALTTAERKLALIEGALGLIEQAASVVEKRVAAGASPRYDQTRIGVTSASAHADLDEARAARARAWAELRAAVGPGAEQLHGSPDYPLEEPLALPEAAALLAVLESQRPDLAAARQRAAAAEAQIGVARRSVWSGVALSALGGFGAAPRQIDVGVGLAAALPLVDRGQGAIPAAQSRARQAQAYLAAVLAPAAQRIAGMREEVLARDLALESYSQRAVSSGDEMLQEAQAGYLAGRFSVLELADAYGAWRESRLRALDLAAAARQAEIELGRQVGKSLREL